MTYKDTKKIDQHKKARGVTGTFPKALTGPYASAAPNSGVPPQDWARVDAAEWERRVGWALGAKEYAVIGSYDDTCDAIHWGISDASDSERPVHINPSTVNDPFIYYNIVKKALK